MKSKTSCFNKTIFLKNITHFWPIWLIFTAWNLFILPFMIYNHSLSYKYSSGINERELAQMRVDDILGIVNVYINPIILFFFSIIVVMAVFSYLYNSRAANTIHALPVTRKELFFTNYISGLLFLIVPEAIGFLFGILVSAVCGYTSMNFLLTGLLFACGISFIFYSFTVWIAMFTGQLLAVPIFTVIINFLYVGCKALIHMLMSIISYGIPLDFPTGKLDVLSPLYYMGTHIYVTRDYSSEYAAATGLKGSNIIAAYAIAAFAFSVAAYFIYRIRDVETAGSLISIPWICPVFRWGAAFCGGGLLSVLFCSILDLSSSRAIFFSALIGAFLFGTVCFFTAQMFLEKGFRVFKKKRFLECGIFLAVFMCLYISIESDLFGQERKMPDASAVKSAFIDNIGISGGSDADTIAHILEIHGQIIDSKKEFEDYSESSQQSGYISILYKLKNNTSLKRSYRIPWKEDLVQDKDSVLSKIIELSASKETYRKELFGVKKQKIKATACQIDLYDSEQNRNDHIFSDEDTEKIYKAVLKDIDEGNFKNCLTNKFFYEKQIVSTYYNTIQIDFMGEEPILSVHADYAPGFQAEGEKSGNTIIEFDADCKNIIAALIETGVINSADDLITIEEYNLLTEENTKES